MRQEGIDTERKKTQYKAYAAALHSKAGVKKGPQLESTQMQHTELQRGSNQSQASPSQMQQQATL